MIGQLKLKNLINSLTKFPQFSIVVGNSGSGKTLFINETCMFKLGCTPIGVHTIDDIKSICEAAVDALEPRAYNLSEFDTMNYRAKEAILKLCEDIPKNIYIFIETQSIANIKQTLLSRAFIFELEHYSQKELEDFCCSTIWNDNPSRIELWCSIFDTPGKLERVYTYGDNLDFINFCTKVTTFVTNASLANTLKISNSLKLKSESAGYDLDLFFDCVSKLALDNIDKLGIDTAYSIIAACSKASSLLTLTPTYNKQMLFDSWLLQIRGVV